MGKVRYDWIDIAKGLLICCMLYGHIRVYGPMDGLRDPVMRLMGHTGGLYGAFFMQSFFVVTGFCASFKVPFESYLWKNVKTLLMPTLLLVLFSEYYKVIFFSHQLNLMPVKGLLNWFVIGGPWFIFAMFWAKMMYWPIVRLKLVCRVVVVAGLYFIGLASCRFGIVNYQCHQHALLMLPYLFVGEWCRDNMEIVERYLKPIAIVGIVLIVTQNVLCQLGYFSLPEHDNAICLSFRNFPVHVVNCITGTAFVFWISRTICQDKKSQGGLLRVLGTGTLIIYLWNGIVYRTIIRLLMPFYMPDRWSLCWAFHILALGLCYIAFYLITRLVYSRRALSWIVGKW